MKTARIRRVALLVALGVVTALVTAGAEGCAAIAGLDKDYAFDDGSAPHDAAVEATPGDASSGIDAASDGGGGDDGGGSDGSTLDAAPNTCELEAAKLPTPLCRSCAAARCCSQLNECFRFLSACESFEGCFSQCDGGLPNGTGRSACVTKCLEKDNGEQQTAVGQLADCIGQNAALGECATDCGYR